MELSVHFSDTGSGRMALSNTNIYASKSDEELIKILHSNKAAEHEFYRRYRIKASWFVRNYKLSALERDDVIQEGMIGLFLALETFQENKNIKFSTYASVCIKNRMQNALSRVWRINTRTDNRQDVEDIIGGQNPFDEVLMSDLGQALEQAVQDLDKSEKLVLTLYLDKKSYQEIAKELAISTKKVDNILMRLKSKLASRVAQGPIDFSVKDWNETLRHSFHRGLRHED